MSMDTSQHQQMSRFNSLSAIPPAEVHDGNIISPRSKNTSQREPWSTVIISGVQQLPLVNDGIKVPLDQAFKVQNHKSGSTGLQKSSSINKRGRKPAETTPVTPKSSQSESFETVRAKMRESLASALELVVNEEDRSQNASQRDDSMGEDTQSLEKVHGRSLGCIISEVTPSNHNSVCSTEIMRETSGQIYGNAPDKLVNSLANVNSDGSLTNGNSADDSSDNLQEFQQKGPLTDDNALSETLLMKDDFLQENGLCWVSFAGSDEMDDQEHHHPKKSKLCCDIFEDSKGKKPQTLAGEIEEELFKLFGGVNKKYKEKGRSLLFNLKDRHNPELRLRVFSGEISPKRLCAMSAEELASKELSQWRIAKAEELAQMVVLPDSDVNLRMVKKTHKGEIQVEVQHDDSAAVEATFGTALLSQFPIKDINENKLLKVGQKDSEGGKSSTELTLCNNRASEEQHHLYNLGSVQQENTDLMQYLMVEEGKDAQCLPPVPSLDEFMMELASEPPFVNLHENDIRGLPRSEEKSPSDDSEMASHVTLESQSEKASSLVTIESNVDPSSSTMKSKSKPGSTSEIGADSMASANWLHRAAPANSIASLDISKKGSQLDIKIPSSVDNLKQSLPLKDVRNGELVWDGLIQLNISSLVTALGFRRSGGQVSTKEWPSFLEIKGRVRLDAFEKFLQELRSSRSRGITVLHFCWKEGSPESGRMKLYETVDSYIVDERVGLAEPVAGLELYFCPPHPKTTQILLSNLSKEHEEALSKADDGLVGILVWKKEISPRPALHPRKHSKKHVAPVAPVPIPEDDRSDYSTKNPHVDPSPPIEEEEEIDDVPPGFGPAAAGFREDDDLPEFSFVQDNLKPAVPKFASAKIPPVPLPSTTRPVEQIREMIQKYGSSENESAWKDEEDDDDIPEWRPDLPVNPSQCQIPDRDQQPNHYPHQMTSQFPPLPSRPIYSGQLEPRQWGGVTLNDYGRGGHPSGPRYRGPTSVNAYSQNQRGWNLAFPRNRR